MTEDAPKPLLAEPVPAPAPVPETTPTDTKSGVGALPNRQLAQYCQRAALPCLDLTPVFVDASHASADALYKQRDAHWTIRGNRVAAEAQAEFLAGLVCPGTRAPVTAPR